MLLHQVQEKREVGNVDKAAMHFLGAHLVGHLGQPQAHPLALGMFDEIDRALDDNGHARRLACGQRTIHSRVDVEQGVARCETGGQALLDLGRGLIERQFLARVAILEPHAAVIQARIERAGAAVADGVAIHLGDELRRRPAGVAAVAIDLVERGGKEHRRVTARGDLNRRLQHRRRVRTDGQQGQICGFVLAQVDQT
ncbi:MAG: hypothetical protein IPM07_15260 [Anaerolineales bacterium]|nr:hypothetical protein [Anaerolineales bacterium]